MSFADEMKKWKQVMIGAIAAYVVVNVLACFTCVFRIGPIVNTLCTLKFASERGKCYTVHEVKTMIESKSYVADGWPYKASVEGQGTNWTLRLDPKPVSWVRRAWWAVAFWDLKHVPLSYELPSTSMVAKCTRWDGHVLFLMDDKKTTTSEPPAAASPSVGRQKVDGQ